MLALITKSLAIFLSLPSLADDSGVVQIVSANSLDKFSKCSKEKQVLCHDTNALVTCSAFRPQSKSSLLLASGGTDCTIKLWDMTKRKYVTAVALVSEYVVSVLHLFKVNLDSTVIPVLSIDTNWTCF